MNLLTFIYLKFLQSKGKRGPIKVFLRYINEYLSVFNNVEFVKHTATKNGEDQETINQDIKQLQSNNSAIGSMIIFYKAIIYSQLYQVKLNRHQYHSMFTLNELTKLNRYNNSFVCHYDKESMYKNI